MKQAKPIEATLKHLVFLPTRDDKSSALIAMHGRGADENDLASVILTLEIPDLILIVPRAPFAFPYGGYAWYNAGQEGSPDEETFRTSLGLVQKFVEQVKAGYPVDPKRLILLGFSQGATMAYATEFANPSMSQGVAALSGYIPSTFRPTALGGVPVFISHGINDMVIPVRYGREAAKLLTEAGADVTYREYFMGHEITEQTIRDLKQWILKLLRTVQN